MQKPVSDEACIVSLPAFNIRRLRHLFIARSLLSQILVLRADKDIGIANEENLRNALSATLLSLPATFSENELLLALAGLSYKGCCCFLLSFLLFLFLFLFL